MSILIKGMKMLADKPLTLVIYPDGTVANVYEDQRGTAVPVPKHGRLIDADAMCDGLAIYNPVVIYAECMPTIIPASEDGVKTEEDAEPWLCLSCRHYPPSSTDGKPCSQCNPSEVWHSCYDPAEEDET